MGEPAGGVGEGVVEVAVFGGVVAAGEAAGQVAVAEEALQRRGGPVAGFGAESFGGGHRAHGDAEAA